jgi:hypothetical protein
MYGCAFYILHLDNHFPPKYSFESYVGVADVRHQMWCVQFLLDVESHGWPTYIKLVGGWRGNIGPGKKEMGRVNLVVEATMSYYSFLWSRALEVGSINWYINFPKKKKKNSFFCVESHQIRGGQDILFPPTAYRLPVISSENKRVVLTFVRFGTY